MDTAGGKCLWGPTPVVWGNRQRARRTRLTATKHLPSDFVKMLMKRAPSRGNTVVPRSRAICGNAVPSAA